MAMTVGEKIRKLRREREWTQEELGERVQIDKRNVSKYETGHINPSQKTVERFAEAFGVSAAELLYDAKAEPSIAIDDPELLHLFREIALLPEDNREAVKLVLSMVVKQNKIQQMIAS